MKYLSEAPFISVIGTPFYLREGEEEKEATVGQVLNFLLNRYVYATNHALDMADIRRLNRVIDTLTKGADETGYVFENEEWGVVKKVFGWYAPVYLGRNAPLLEDILLAVRDKPTGE